MNENMNEMLTRAEILDKAKACVCGKRQEDYGTPENNFRFIAELWAAYLSRVCVSQGSLVVIAPKDVAMMMALLKIARIGSSLEDGTADSYIDLAGYAACGGECADIEFDNCAVSGG